MGAEIGSLLIIEAWPRELMGSSSGRGRLIGTARPFTACVALAAAETLLAWDESPVSDLRFLGMTKAGASSASSSSAALSNKRRFSSPDRDDEVGFAETGFGGLASAWPEALSRTRLFDLQETETADQGTSQKRTRKPDPLGKDGIKKAAAT